MQSNDQLSTVTDEHGSCQATMDAYGIFLGGFHIDAQTFEAWLPSFPLFGKDRQTSTQALFGMIVVMVMLRLELFRCEKETSSCGIMLLQLLCSGTCTKIERRAVNGRPGEAAPPAPDLPSSQV